MAVCYLSEYSAGGGPDSTGQYTLHLPCATQRMEYSGTALLPLSLTLVYVADRIHFTCRNNGTKVTLFDRLSKFPGRYSIDNLSTASTAHRIGQRPVVGSASGLRFGLHIETHPGAVAQV